MSTFAVLITTYNGEKYIREQISSIINQSKKPDKIYIFDDGSSDETNSIVDNMLSDTSIPFFHQINEQRIGWKKNFYNGMCMVKEDYLFFCDQDDIWETNKIQMMSNILESNKNIGVLSSNYKLLLCDNCTTEKIAEAKRLNYNGELVKLNKTKKNYYIRQPGCTLCCSRSIILQAIPHWNEDLPYDAMVWKIGLFTNSLYSLNVPLIQWRRHSSNATRKSKESREHRIQMAYSDFRFIESYTSSVCQRDVFLEEVKIFSKERYFMLTKRNVFKWFNLFVKYSEFYVSKKSCLGDLYFLLARA